MRLLYLSRLISQQNPTIFKLKQYSHLVSNSDGRQVDDFSHLERRRSRTNHGQVVGEDAKCVPWQAILPRSGILYRQLQVTAEHKSNKILRFSEQINVRFCIIIQNARNAIHDFFFILRDFKNQIFVTYVTFIKVGKSFSKTFETTRSKKGFN